MATNSSVKTVQVRANPHQQPFIHSRFNGMFAASLALCLGAGISSFGAEKLHTVSTSPDDPIKVVKGKHVTFEFRQSDWKLLKNQDEYVAFMDGVYEKMNELTYAHPPMILRGWTKLGAWGTAGEDGVRIDWTCIPPFMKGFNDGLIEFGMVHEMGHVFDARSFPRWYITPHCGGETFANIKLSYALEMLLRPDNAYRIVFGPGGRQTGYDFNNNFYLNHGKGYLAGTNSWANMDVDDLESFHLNLIRKYGWDVYKKWFRAYYLIEAQPDGRAPSSTDNPLRMNLICALLSSFSGENLVPQFQQWRIPVTDESVKAVRERYKLDEVCPAVEKQIAKEYAEGKITLDPLSLRITVHPVPNKAAVNVGFFTAVKVDGAVIRYTLGNSSSAKVWSGKPITVTKPTPVSAAMYVPGKKEPVLKASLQVNPASATAAAPRSAS